MSMNQSAIQNRINQVVSIGLVFVLTLDSWLDLFRRAFAHHDTSQILLAPIVAGLIFMQRWRERAKWQVAMDSTPYRFMPVATICLGYMLYWLGALQDIIYLWHVGALLCVFAVSSRVFDRQTRFYRLYLPCLPLILFMAPLPGVFQDTLNHYLLMFNQQIVLTVLSLAQFEFSQSGRVIEVNGQMISIVDACNGLRVFYSMIIVCWYFQVQLASRFSKKEHASFWRKGGLWFFLLIPVISLVLNSARLIVTAIAYGVLSAGKADHVHEIAGWVLVALVWLIFHRLTQVPQEEKNAEATTEKHANHGSLFNRTGWLILKCLLLVSVLLFNLSRDHQDRVQKKQVAELVQRLPYSTEIWVGYDKSIEELSLPSDLSCYLYRYYEGHDHQKRLLMVGQTHIRNLSTHKAAQCYVSRGWQVSQTATDHKAASTPFSLETIDNVIQIKKTLLTRFLNGERHYLVVQESIVPLPNIQDYALMIHTATKVASEHQFETSQLSADFNHWALRHIQQTLAASS